MGIAGPAVVFPSSVRSYNSNLLGLLWILVPGECGATDSSATWRDVDMCECDHKVVVYASVEATTDASAEC